MALTFEWDAPKSAANVRKHGITFDEATTVFGDPLGWFETDPTHADSETRLRLLGRSSANRLLAVLFTDRGQSLIRIISARLATPRERRKYAKDFHS